ncbi:MAG: hypothetical protein KAT06_12665 [Gammaproteobacteria bacterium]|nr:hypothetical protein [Gammaproteobacteria bacterium]
MSNMSSPASLKRRQVLSGLMKLLGLIGLAFLSVPFISSFSSNEIHKKQQASTAWIIKHPVTDFTQGKVTVLNWSGGVVWVYARTENNISWLNENDVELRDAFSKQSDQPEQMRNNFRSDSEKYFVFIPLENKKGCQVRLSEGSEKDLFSEPCFSAKYDAAGRIFKNSGHQDQINLSIPEHVVEDGILKIGIWMPKI